MALDDEKGMNKEKLAEAGAPAESTVSEGRRKAIKAGLIGTPLLITLRGAPAWSDIGLQGTTGGTVAGTGPTLTQESQPTDL